MNQTREGGKNEGRRAGVASKEADAPEEASLESFGSAVPSRIPVLRETQSSLYTPLSLAQPQHSHPLPDIQRTSL